MNPAPAAIDNNSKRKKKIWAKKEPKKTDKEVGSTTAAKTTTITAMSEEQDLENTVLPFGPQARPILVPKPADDLIMKHNYLIDNRDGGIQLVKDLPPIQLPRILVNNPPKVKGPTARLGERLQKAAAWGKVERDPSYQPMENANASTSTSSAAAAAAMKNPSPPASAGGKPLWSAIANRANKRSAFATTSSKPEAALAFNYAEEFPALIGRRQNPEQEKAEASHANREAEKKLHEEAVQKVLETFTISNGQPKIEQVGQGYTWMEDQERRENEELQDRYFINSDLPSSD